MTDEPFWFSRACTYDHAESHPYQTWIAMHSKYATNYSKRDYCSSINPIKTYLRKVEAFDAREKVMSAQQTVDSPWGERWFKEYDEGVLEGIHTSLRLQLTYKFGELPSDFVKQLYAIKDEELLSTITLQVLTVQSLDEITLTPPLSDSGRVIRKVLYIPLPYVTPNSKRMREVAVYATRIT